MSTFLKRGTWCLNSRQLVIDVIESMRAQNRCRSAVQCGISVLHYECGHKTGTQTHQEVDSNTLGKLLLANFSYEGFLQELCAQIS